MNLVDVMADTLLDRSQHGTGISAVQIGVPVRVVLLNHKRIRGSEIVLINPEPISISGRPYLRKEGCLSLPDHYGEVRRRNKISIKALDVHGKEFTYSARGYEATVVQHELDHLDGILYWDRIVEGGTPKLRQGHKGDRG